MEGFKRNKFIIIIILLLLILCFKSKIAIIEADTYTQTTKLYASLDVGDNLQLGLEDTADKITWASSKKSVAAVSSKGLVTAKSQGKTIITASSGEDKYSFGITVTSHEVSSPPTPKPTSKPTLAPTPTPKIESVQDDKSITVYVTKTGSKYHRSGCRYLSKSKIPISLYDAKKYYSPCSVCDPPQ